MSTINRSVAQLDASAGNADGDQFKTQYTFGNSSSVREQFDRAVANLSGVMQRFQVLPLVEVIAEQLAIRLRV